jgi:predicted dehydrogenase
VLCEKPFAMNSEEVNEMISVAKENHVLLMEALWTYFLPHYQHALDLIKNDNYGKIISLKADFGFYTPFDTSNRVFRKSVGGGSLLDIGIYPIFAALSTLGEPESIDANATFFENGVDASCTMTFHYPKAKAYLCSTLLEKTPTEAIFVCEDATITLNTRFHEPSSITIEKDGHKELIEFPTDRIGYAFEIEHFNQLLRDGKKESDIMNFAFSRKLMKTLDAVRKLIQLSYD